MIKLIINWIKVSIGMNTEKTDLNVRVDTENAGNNKQPKIPNLYT